MLLLLKSVLACRVPELEAVEHVQVVLSRVLVDNHFPCKQNHNVTFAAQCRNNYF